jgi:hypothetical protein
MLALDDPQWATLAHAYGPATDIPGLLRKLTLSVRPSAARDEPWWSLWSSLCHQGDVYSASYAALPHVVQIAFDASGPVDMSFFLLPASIEIARHNGRGPEIPSFLRESYKSGLVQIMDCVQVHRHEPWDQDTLQVVAAAQAVSKGLHRIAEALVELDNDWMAKILADDR